MRYLLLLFLMFLPLRAEAQVNLYPDTRSEYDVVFAGPLNTPLKRIAYVLRLREELRLHHNMMGAKYRNGEITEEQWYKYKENSFRPRQHAANAKLNEFKQYIREDISISVDLANAFQEINN